MLNAPAAYFHWAFVLISWSNLFLIVGMVVLFLLALLVPFPRRSAEDEQPT